MYFLMKIRRRKRGNSPQSNPFFIYVLNFTNKKKNLFLLHRINFPLMD